ncbi:Arginine--pyruvate transaminase AruH [compost metagenome]
MLFGVQPFIADMTAYALTHDIDTARQMREAYKSRSRRIVDGLADAPGILVLPPEAGMFTLIDVSATGMTGEAFAWALLEEEGVAVMPGSSFGDEAQNFLRVSLTVPDKDIDEACRRITALAERATLRQERRA